MHRIAWLVVLVAAPAAADVVTLTVHGSGEITADALDRVQPALERCLAASHVAGHVVVKRGKVDKQPASTAAWGCVAGELEKLAARNFEIDLAWEPITLELTITASGKRDAPATRTAFFGWRGAMQRCFGMFASTVTLTLDVARDGGITLVRGDGDPGRVACVAGRLSALPPGEPDRVVIVVHQSDAEVGASPPQRGAAPPPRISVFGKRGDDDATLTPDLVLAKVTAAYMAGIKRCYKHVLDKDATAGGKIAIAFTVNKLGRAVNGTATTFEPSLDRCIASLIAGWRFPVPKDKDGDPTEATFRLVLQGGAD